MIRNSTHSIKEKKPQCIENRDRSQKKKLRLEKKVIISATLFRNSTVIVWKI